MAWIKKRTGDWWFFTLIPLFIFLLISFLLYVTHSPLILLITQQLFFYSLILSSTEIGIQFRINSQLEQSKFKGSWLGFMILLVSGLLLPVIYVNNNIFLSCPYLFLTASIICTLMSIWMSNQNEYSGIIDFGTLRERQQEGFSENVENPRDTYKEVKI